MISATPISVELLNAAVYRVRLKLEKPVHFKAGQYIELSLSDNISRPFSIANAPVQNDEIELHLSAQPISPFIRDVVNALEQKNNIYISQAKGNAWFREDSARPKILVAGGSGFAYANSILTDWLSREPQTELTLFWGGSKPHTLYWMDKLSHLAENTTEFRFIPVIEEMTLKWQSLTGNVIDAVTQVHSSLSGYDIYMAGPFSMSYYGKQRFINDCKAEESRMYSDAFDYPELERELRGKQTQTM